MHPLFRSLPLAILSLAIGSCSQEITPPQPLSALSPGGTAPIVTDASRYTLEATSNGWRGRIGYVFTNRTDQSIGLLNCNGSYALRLEKQQGDEWVSAWSPPVPECLSPPIEIEQASSLQHEVEIFAGRPGSNLHPQFAVGEIDGTYRLVVESAYWNYDHDGPPWGDTVPVEYRVSHPFEIRTRR